MEISVHGRKQRRRHFRAVLPAVPCHYGSSDSVDGACHRKRKQKEYRARVWGTGEERAEVAYPRIRCPHRKLSADDVLHRRCRLDAVLFLQLFNRKIQRPDRRRRNRKIQRDAFISVDSCHYHADYYNCRLSDLFGGSAERRGACYKGDDDRVDGHHDFPCGLQLYDAGCQRGTEILSGAGYAADRTGGTVPHYHKRDEPGIFYAEPWYRRDADFRQLLKRRKIPARRGSQHCSARYVCSDYRRPHHFPGVLLLQRTAGQRPEADLYDAAAHFHLDEGRTDFRKLLLPVPVLCGAVYHHRCI